MSDEKEKPGKVSEKIGQIIKKVNLPTLIKIARFLGIPIMKDP